MFADKVSNFADCSCGKNVLKVTIIPFLFFIFFTSLIFNKSKPKLIFINKNTIKKFSYEKAAIQLIWIAIVYYTILFSMIYKKKKKIKQQKWRKIKNKLNRTLIERIHQTPSWNKMQSATSKKTKNKIKK